MQTPHGRLATLQDFLTWELLQEQKKTNELLEKLLQSQAKPAPAPALAVKPAAVTSGATNTTKSAKGL